MDRNKKLWFVFWIGGGALCGGSLVAFIAPSLSTVGGVVGGLAGFGIAFLVGNLGRWQNRKHPPCRCGKDNWADFTLDTDPTWGSVHKCACGLRYVMGEGWLWCEILPNGRPQHYARRGFWGNWNLVAKKDKANETAEPIADSRADSDVAG